MPTCTLPELEEFEEILNGDPEIPRQSVDSKVNKYGRILLNLCKSYGLYIVNGRFGEQSNGFTYVTQHGCSTIDYYIISRDVFELVKQCEVASQPESSHLPLTLQIKVDADTNYGKNKQTKNRTYFNINDENCNAI